MSLYTDVTDKYDRLSLISLSFPIILLQNIEKITDQSEITKIIKSILQFSKRNIIDEENYGIIKNILLKSLFFPMIIKKNFLKWYNVSTVATMIDLLSVQL